MKELISLDQQLFLLLNHLPHNGFFDTLALLLSGVGTAGIIWFVLGVLLFLREERKDHSFITKLVGVGFSTWALVELILKPLVARPRPTIGMGASNLGIHLADSYSFPSGHATIAWAMAYLFSLKEPRWRWAFYVLAVAISFSRIYLGKHYPLDVVAGGLIGWVIGNRVLRMKGGEKKQAA